MLDNATDTDTVTAPHTVTNSLTEGLGPIFPSYRGIIIKHVQSVFKIDFPEERQIFLIQSLVFTDCSCNQRIVWIQQTVYGKSLQIQYYFAMRCYVTVIVTPLISIGADQVSNIHYSYNPETSTYAEHLDSVRDAEDRRRMVKYLNNLSNVTLRNKSVIFISLPLL